MEPMSAATQSGPVRTFTGHDGLPLAVEHFDAGDSAVDAPWLLYLHGFGQSRLAWRATAYTLAQRGWTGMALDGRGHGDSGWHPQGAYTLDDNVADVALLAKSRPRRPILVGASMGGLLGLLAEGEIGGLFEALVLVDVTPRWEEKGVERVLDFMAAHPEGFESLEAAQAAIEAYLPHRSRKDPERLRTQLREGADGRWRWHWDPRLMASVTDKGAGYIPRLVAASAKVRTPVMLLSGALSDVVSQRTIDEFCTLVPHAGHEVIPDATHMVVGDQNVAFTRAIARWLDQHAAAGASLSSSRRDVEESLS
jgi:pimeloyl-ACP methyl ester carboxylesterase